MKKLLLGIFLFSKLAWSTDLFIEQLLKPEASVVERLQAMKNLRELHNSIDAYSFAAQILTSPSATRFLPLSRSTLHELIKSSGLSLTEHTLSLEWINLISDPGLSNLPAPHLLKLLRWERGEHLKDLTDDAWIILLRGVLFHTFEQIRPMSPHAFFSEMSIPDDLIQMDSIYFDEVMRKYFIMARNNSDYLDILLTFLNEHYLKASLSLKQMTTLTFLISNNISRGGRLGVELEKIAVLGLMNFLDDKYLYLKIDLIESLGGYALNSFVSEDGSTQVRQSIIEELLTEKFPDALLPNPSNQGSCFKWVTDLF